jgi:hypothetical protein
MASNVRIDGALPDPGDNSTMGLVLSGGWAVEYDWNLDRATATNQLLSDNRMVSYPIAARISGTITGSFRR